MKSITIQPTHGWFTNIKLPMTMDF